MMGQPGFFDLENRNTGLDKCGDPLAAIGRAVPFEMFRSQLQEALIKGGLRRVDADRKTAAGRKPWDEVLNNRHLCRDCQDFRVWAGIMGKKGTHYVPEPTNRRGHLPTIIIVADRTP
jgi:hypothetical protein